MEDPDGTVEQLRNVLNKDSKIIKKIADKIDDEPSDTKRGEMS